MRRTARIGGLTYLLAASVAAGDYSYVVLNNSARNSLVRISPDGKFIATIASEAAGHGLAKDRSGNYIVAAVGSLLRVTPHGIVSIIAKAPSGSQWLSVVQDTTGAFIVADNQQHALWRISEDGTAVAKFVNYAAGNTMEDTSIALDGHGNYLLLEDNGPVRFHRITPQGDIIPIKLTRTMNFATGLVSDGPDGYLAADGKGRSILRLTAAGEVSEIAKFSPARPNITAVVRDPETREIIAVANFEHSFLRTSADGQTTTILSIDQTFLPFPSAILVETGRIQPSR